MKALTVSLALICIVLASLLVLREPVSSPVDEGEADPAPESTTRVDGSGAEIPSTEEVASEPPPQLPEGSVDAFAILEAQFISDFRVAWKEYREDEPTAEILERARKQFRQLFEGLPRGIARRLAEEVTEKEELASVFENGDAQRLLELADKGRLDLSLEELENSVEKFVAPRLQTGAVNGEVLRRDDVLKSGMTLRFGRGRHSLQRKLRSQEETPTDLTLSGVGIDQTILVVDRNFASSTDFERLRIEHMTVFTSSNELLTAYRGQLVLDLDSVRLVGFDSGAGGSNLFEGRGLFVRARDCEILGGYGRSPGFGNFIRNGPVFAVFERCGFAGFNLRVSGGGHRIVYSGCSFDGLGHDPRDGVSSRDRVEFRGCSFSDEVKERRREKLQLRDLLPHLY